MTLVKAGGIPFNEAICDTLGAVMETMVEATGLIDAIRWLKVPPLTVCKASEMTIGPWSVEGSEAFVGEIEAVGRRTDAVSVAIPGRYDCRFRLPCSSSGCIFFALALPFPFFLFFLGFLFGRPNLGFVIRLSIHSRVQHLYKFAFPIYVILEYKCLLNCSCQPRAWEKKDPMASFVIFLGSSNLKSRPNGKYFGSTKREVH